MRRGIELDRLGGDNLVQVGLRGYATLDQYEAGEKAGVHRITSTQFSRMGAEEAAAQALAWAGKGTNSIYLTVDLDVVQPGEAPGTGWPEPGGLTGQEVLDFVAVAAPYVAAIDIAELNPLYDTASRTTALLAARIVLDFICARL